MSTPAELHLKDTTYAELFLVNGLERLDARFLDYLAAHDGALCDGLRDYRCGDGALTAVQCSELLIGVAPYLELFVAELFGIEHALVDARAATAAENQVLRFKQQFVLRRARRYRGEPSRTFEELERWLDQRLGAQPQDREAAIARFGLSLLEDKGANAEAIERLTQWCVLALKDPQAQARVAGWPSFKLPQRLDHARLVTVQPVAGDGAGRLEVPPERRRRRDGFALTDARMSPRAVQGEVYYCLYCHGNDNDSCSKGFPEKKGAPEQGLRVDPHGAVLTGCPLEQKISESHLLKRDGHTIAALATIMVDNPMVPATGHRICNDCMKACIYQKQDPVDIPEIETRVLSDVLALPWGVEIYDLLTRWNPLRRTQYLPKPYNGRKVLIAGMGPAGFTMAHHLTLEGCAVVGIEGLKVEPLPPELLHAPVRDFAQIEEPLDRRTLAGFGGVAEYGITARWDKNFLKLIYLSLARRAQFQVFGGVRFGGTLTLDDAWALGFDHVCVATGAGLPHVLPMGNSLARGMRQASDFLMALQLTGAAKDDSLANLQLRLPAVVIGGGLTAIDTATEVQAYYVKQVEKTLARYERLRDALGEDGMLAGLDEEHRAILHEFLDHGQAVRVERERAAAAGETPDFLALIRAWGGVTLVYRRTMNESPAYRRNHEEIGHALAEGIYYAEALEPERAELDRFAHAAALVCRRRVREPDGRWVTTGEEVVLPARAVFVAAGALPNTIYEREHPGTFELDHHHFRPYAPARGGLEPVPAAEHCKAAAIGALTSYCRDDHRVSFIGDTHPVFHGSVVRAIASAKRCYPQVMAVLGRQPPAQSLARYAEFRARMTDLLTPRVTAVRRDDPNVVELWVRAPMAARNFGPGQFFRLQTFERSSPVVHNTRLQVPVQTVSGAQVKGDQIRLLVLRGGANARLAERLDPGDPVVLMGPAGAPARLPHHKTVAVIAGKWGAAVMLHLGPALRAAGNRVLYFAVYRGAGEVYCRDELEAAADRIIWASASEPRIEPARPQDTGVREGDVVRLLRRYAGGEFDGAQKPAIPLRTVDEVLVMGPTGLLRALRAALRAELRDCFARGVRVIGSVGSPMQCMLKGVCAQCLQWQVDPETGERTEAVFSCAQQDQPLFAIDLDNLAARQAQNRLPEYLTSLWLDEVVWDDLYP